MFKLSSQEALARLASKPGVQATLVLSRKDGAVIQSSGFPSPESSGQVEAGSTAALSSTTGQAWQSNARSTEDAPNSAPDTLRQARTAEDTARAVFKYISDTGAFLSSVQGSDDVQLLRLRTKQQEIVVVPGKAFCHANSHVC